MYNCKKSCPDGKVCNKKTGRCVKSRSRSPVSSRSQKRCKKPCDADKICNPKTGRCIKSDGKVGKLINKKTPSPKPKRKSPSPKPKRKSPSPKPKRKSPSPKPKRKSPSPKPKLPSSKTQSEDNEIISINKTNARIPEIVSGLLRFEIYYSKKYNKIIYILGEVHNKTRKCDNELKSVTADKFFYRLINKAHDLNIRLDVFLEAGYDPKDKYINKFDISFWRNYDPEEAQGFMGNVKIKLSKLNCGTNNIYFRCPYTNTRFHSTDIRKTSQPLIQYLEELTQYVNYCVKEKEKEEYKHNENNCKKYLNNIKNYIRNDSIHNLSQDLYKALIDTKIIKQLENIPEKNKDAKNYLLKIYEEAVNIYLPKTTKDFIDKLTASSEEFGIFELYKHISYLNIEVVIKISSIIDKLLLSKNRQKMLDILRQELNYYEKQDKTEIEVIKFIERIRSIIILSNNKEVEKKLHKQKLDIELDIKKHNNAIFSIIDLNKSYEIATILMDLYLGARIFRQFKQFAGKYSEEPKNIIIYAGDAHAENYSKMFKELKFTKIFSGKKIFTGSSSSCLDLSELKEIFFLK